MITEDEIDAWGRRPFVYRYEPETVRFAERFEGRILWRGPHRFHHPDDLKTDGGETPIRLLGALYRRDHVEVLPWARETFPDEGYGKRSRWCRSAFQYIFRHEDDALLFRLRWC